MDGEKKLILLIDDDINLLTTLKDFLSYEGYRVETADCGEEGLKRLKSITPDLIILDMSMPGMGGIGFLNELSKDGRPSHPVLVLTARSNMAEFFADMEVDGFIAKPCDPADLLMEVGRIIFLRSGEASGEGSGFLTSRARVLLAEDNDSIRLSLSRILQDEGYIVDGVSRGPAVLERAVLARPDIIVMKHILSSMNGDMVASVLHDMANVADIPIVLYDCAGDQLSKTSNSVRSVLMTSDGESLKTAIRDVLSG